MLTWVVVSGTAFSPTIISPWSRSLNDMGGNHHFASHKSWSSGPPWIARYLNKSISRSRHVLPDQFSTFTRNGPFSRVGNYEFEPRLGSTASLARSVCVPTTAVHDPLWSPGASHRPARPPARQVGIPSCGRCLLSPMPARPTTGRPSRTSRLGEKDDESRPPPRDRNTVNSPRTSGPTIIYPDSIQYSKYKTTTHLTQCGIVTTGRLKEDWTLEPLL